jgi:1-deoxy-D-xylulose-5-phosphate synthase
VRIAAAGRVHDPGHGRGRDVGAAIADELAELTLGAPQPPRVRVLGIPCAYLPHGKPDQILADAGLDAAGITASALSLVTAHQLDTPPV